MHLVVPLLPSTLWKETQVGIRIEFAARNPKELLERFRSARIEAQSKASALELRPKETYVPWPKSLTDYLKIELLAEFGFQYFVLDKACFNDDHEPQEEYQPFLLGNEPSGGWTTTTFNL